MQLENKQELLSLVRLGIGNQTNSYHENYDWSFIHSLAEKHGLSAIILDGINCLPEIARPPKEVLLQWIGSTIQSYEYRYTSYQKAIAGLAGWYNANGYKMMVLKGFACSIDWPKPEHRPCGDIDIWQFGQQREADAALDSWFKVQGSSVKIDNSHHHHTVFEWQGFTVENHYDFINVHHHKSNAAFEKILKEQGQNNGYFVELSGERVYLPSPNLHALFLLKHACMEFAASGLNLRQLLDWAFFVKAHRKEIDWVWLEGILEKFGMKRLYNVFNAICVADLGFDVSIFPNVQFDPNLKDRVLNEMLSPAIPNDKPKFLLSRVVWKWHRWKANEWKHNLAYKESMWSAFWSGVWGHILKPASI